MSLETKLNASEIVREAGMVSRPEFYSGRGAITCDLNDKILEDTYRVIEREHGVGPANQYAQMVADIPKLSATDFLLTLYRLEGNKWNWDKRILGHEKGVYVDGPNDQAKMAVGMATLAGAFFGDSARDETWQIRSSFLARHKIKAPKSDDPWHDAIEIIPDRQKNSQKRRK